MISLSDMYYSVMDKQDEVLLQDGECNYYTYELMKKKGILMASLNQKQRELLEEFLSVHFKVSQMKEREAYRKAAILGITMASEKYLNIKS